MNQAVERIESKISNIPDESDLGEDEDEEVDDLSSDDESDAVDPETVHVDINFGGVGISLVDSFPREILYMCMESLNMELIMCESNKISLGMTVLKFQIDSNLPNTKYNVLLGSTEAGEPNPDYDPENPDDENPGTDNEDPDAGDGTAADTGDSTDTGGGSGTAGSENDRKAVQTGDDLTVYPLIAAALTASLAAAAGITVTVIRKKTR